MGSEAATMSNLYGYRRSDFAYRFLRRLDGEDPELAEDPADRDRLHDLLRAARRSVTPGVDPLRVVGRAPRQGEDGLRPATRTSVTHPRARA